MARGDPTGPGQVSSTPERPPPRHAYDVVVLGAGLLGAVVADRVRASAPGASLLLAEAGGLPNEDGATVSSPGLLPPLRMDEPATAVDGARPFAAAGAASPDRGALAWARAWSLEALGGAGKTRPAATGGAGWLVLEPVAHAGEGAAAGGAPGGGRAPDAAPLHALLPADVALAACALTGVARDHPAWLLDGGYLSAEALALALARRAVEAGADLLLNARARPQGRGRILLERLGVDRRMRVGVHARQAVEARTVVVACGAAGAVVSEEGLDRPVGLASAYLQFPRVRLPGPAPDAGLPVVALGGWAWRPAPGGAMLVPPPLPPDPEGFEPVGGRLLGVPVGLRRELVDRLLDAPALAPLLASGKLELGKSVRAVRGGRFSVPPDGRPVAERLAQGWWLVAGGTLGLAHDVAAAAGVAAAVAGRPAPWQGGG